MQAVRSGTGHAPAPVIRRLNDATLSSLQSCSNDDVRRVVMESPTKSCALDPIRTFLLKECMDILLPFLAVMVNASLRDGSLPASQKRAVVSPLLKKPSLDPSCRDVQLYRPVSNLTFVSKVVERVVASQLTRYLQSHDLMPRMQSAYRKYHTTETALLRVLSDIYAAVDERRVTLLALLDLSAAFYCGTTTYSCAVFNWRTESKVWRQRGSHHSSAAGPTEYSTSDSYQKSATFCSVSHKALYWAGCFSCCTSLSWPRSLLRTASLVTSTLTIHRCISAYPYRLLMLLAAYPPASSALKVG